MAGRPLIPRRRDDTTGGSRAIARWVTPASQGGDGSQSYRENRQDIDEFEEDSAEEDDEEEDDEEEEEGAAHSDELGIDGEPSSAPARRPAGEHPLLQRCARRKKAFPRRVLAAATAVAVIAGVSLHCAKVPWPGAQASFSSSGSSISRSRSSRSSSSASSAAALFEAAEVQEHQDDSADETCERCPIGLCDRQADRNCVWFKGDLAYHCRVNSCKEVPKGHGVTGCWRFEGHDFYNLKIKDAPCQRQVLPRGCELCPVGTCDRESSGNCVWFEGDLAYHCKVDKCDEVPLGPAIGLCWEFEGGSFYSIKDKKLDCRSEAPPVTSTTPTTTQQHLLSSAGKIVADAAQASTSRTSKVVGEALESAAVGLLGTVTSTTQTTTPGPTATATSTSTKTTTTKTVTTTADARLARDFPEVNYIWLPETEMDRARSAQMSKEAQLWIPGGESKVRHTTGVNPTLWPGGGNYQQVERWCSTLKPNAKLGAHGAKWWRKPQKEVEYAELKPDGKPAMPGTIMHHVGCTLSHFITWMDARARGLAHMIVAESDGTPSWFGTYAGFIEDFKYVVLEIVRHGPKGWDVILLDKCRMGAVGGPLMNFSHDDMRSSYHIYKWLGRGWAGAALYLVSKAFLDQVPKMVHDNGLFMVDSYLDWRCQEDLKCFSVCASSPPFDSPAFG